MAKGKPSKRSAKVPTISARLFDARPDRIDFRDLPYRPPLKSLPYCYPDDTILETYLRTYVEADLVLDQGTEGACTGFGLACVINYLFWTRRIETGSRKRFDAVSPRMLYELARRYDEWPGERYEGSSCRGALKGWHKHGVCSGALWPYTIDDEGDVVFTPPKAGWELDALGRTLGIYYRVDRRSIVDLQAAIVNIGAVYVSCNVHNGWDKLLHARPTSPPATMAGVPDIGLPTPKSKLGGHAFALVGFDTRGFIVQNSWGRNWGASGFGRLLYADWTAHGTDAWACALGVPGDPTAVRVANTRWRVPAGQSVVQFDRVSRVARNPAEDPWPVDHEFNFKGYEPLSTADAYAQTLVTDNDGELAIRDMTKGGNAAADQQAREALFDRPRDWFGAHSKGAAKLAIYAHGGLNGEEESIRRIRVLAPYFLANGIYPVFLTWRTGAADTLKDIMADWIRKIPGFDAERAAGLADWLAEQKDRAIEPIARVFGRGIWSEMRENAERSMVRGHGLDLVTTHLGALAKTLLDQKRKFELHFVGHSAGAILLGHLLEHMASVQWAGPSISSCSLFAPACSVEFTNDRYVAADGSGRLPLNRLWLSYLTDENEKKDGLPSPDTAIYGKSLLYLVSRALDDERKMPILGLERAHQSKFVRDDEQWADDQLDSVARWQAAWNGSDGTSRTQIVADPTVRVTRTNVRIHATHGSFDNNIEVLTSTLERIRGARLVSELEWLDY
jgi:hypothetical protein